MPSLRNSTSRPVIESVAPPAALPGGEIRIRGKNFPAAPRPVVTIGGCAAPLTVASSRYIVARVPQEAVYGEVLVRNGSAESESAEVVVATLVADNLHPVANPAIDREGNVFTTFSGSRGQKTPVSVYKIDPAGEVTPFLSDLTNATGLAFDSEGVLHVSSRFDGIVYQVSDSAIMTVYVEGMGVATGIAFDAEGNLFVGDRSGTIFKISKSRQIYVFTTLEPSVAAYHLAFGPDGYLYVTGPTTSSYDCIYRVAPSGEVETFFRGLGRPQGLAFDADGNLYAAASWRGRKGIVRLTPKAEITQFLSGSNIVGLAFAPSGDLYITTTGALYRAPVGIRGWWPC